MTAIRWNILNGILRFQNVSLHIPLSMNVFISKKEMIIIEVSRLAQVTKHVVRIKNLRLRNRPYSSASEPLGLLV